MSHFPAINAAMYSIFGTSPPTRAAVAVDLPHNQRVRIDCIAHSNNERNHRHALHVQSISYWAPANIGPYSQSITIDRTTMFVSGQIALIPKTMKMATIAEMPGNAVAQLGDKDASSRSVILEIALALQHAQRVAEATMDGLGLSHDLPNLVIRSALLWAVNKEHIPYISAAWSEFQKKRPYLTPHAVIVGASSLPRDALVEAQLVYNTGYSTHSPDEEDDSEGVNIIAEQQTHLPGDITTSDESFSNAFRVVTPALHPSSRTSSRMETNDDTPTYIECRGPDILNLLKQSFPGPPLPLSRQSLHVRAFYTPNIRIRIVYDIAQLLFGRSPPDGAISATASGITPAPARFLASTDGQYWDVVFVLL